ncbi:MAG TPA: DNA internalization-related competence protein ComEC/Rec2 [Acholeplasmataceae bacterium]|nr:DNA internalization-related competence protein ComEC/Rec2 [Acholeplasmataceae bacterium]
MHNEITGEVISVKKKESHQELIVKKKRNKVLIYNNLNKNIYPGMIIYCFGENIIPDENHIEYDFNYQKYLWRNHINGIIKSESIEIVGRKLSINIIPIIFTNYFELNFNGLTLTFLKALLLGDSSSLDEVFYDSLICNGTIHLFAISGLHISLFVGIIYYFLKKFNLKEKCCDAIIIGFLCVYLIITSFSPSILRASLMYIFRKINQKLNLNLSSLDIISIIFVFLILINPYYMYNLGFVLSFLVAFVIILSQTIVNGSNIKQMFLISVFAQIATIPISININNEINILSPLTNLVFIILMETIILPFSLLVSVFPLLQTFYYYIVLSYSSLSIFLSKYFTVILKFRDFNHFMIMIYYGLIILFLQNYHKTNLRKTILLLFFGYIFCIYNCHLFTFHGEVNFLDLYNGEAILITEPFGKSNILIDTGDGTNNAVTNYLKNKGIRSLDLLIITHNHRDHNGELESLVRHFHINKIVVSAYYNSDLTKLDNVITVKEGNIIECGNIRFSVLHPDKEYKDENDNSIVLYTKIGGLKYLFMGDATKNIELKFSDLNVDIIKVAHHGSSTSTSDAFIKSIKPRYAIIQCGRIEKFGFPHQDVINILEKNNVIIYRTDKHYSIKIKYYKKERIFKTLR